MIAPSVLPKIVAGVALLGATAGVVGSFAVLRRRSLLGDTLAHAALPGICIAHMLLATRDLLALSVGALIAGLLGVVLVTAIPRWTRTREDAALGLVLSTFFGAGVVLLSVIQRQATGGQAGLDSYLFGEVASLTSRDVYRLAIVGVVALTAVAIFFKELKLLCFDEGFAGAQGWPTFLLDLGMMSAIATVTIISLPICGVILIAAILIFPCTTARFWSDRLGVVLILSGLLGAACAVGGVLSVQSAGVASAGLPPGPMIVLVSAAVFVASVLFAPGRGLIARAIQTGRLRVKVATDHVLRLMYELSEPHIPNLPAVSRSELRGRLSCTSFTFWLVLRLAHARDWIDFPTAGQLQLTESGVASAARLTRAHRLWELFLVTHADIAADHVHRDADDLEHFLPAELVEALERQLANEGRLPGHATTSGILQSVHPSPNVAGDS